jgi:polyisoprenyl-phosphate glycosyltransferase
MDDGYDVVYARRRTRARESALKLATSSAFYRVLASLSEVKIPNDTGDYRIMSRRVLDRLNSMPEQDRFMRGMVAWLGGRQTELLYDRDPRFAGETAYTYAALLRLAAAAITSFSTVPLRLAVYLAFLGIVIGFALMAYTIFSFVVGRSVPGWTSLGMMLCFFSVGQFFCLAIIGTYLGRVFMQVKGRPLYFVDRVVTSPAPSPTRTGKAAQRALP